MQATGCCLCLLLVVPPPLPAMHTAGACRHCCLLLLLALLAQPALPQLAVNVLKLEHKRRRIAHGRLHNKGGGRRWDTAEAHWDVCWVMRGHWCFSG